MTIYNRRSRVGVLINQFPPKMLSSPGCAQHSTVVLNGIQTVSSYLTSCLLCHTADDPLDALHPHLELHVVGGGLQLVDVDYLVESPQPPHDR